jgi:hypothetical protein
MNWALFPAMQRAWSLVAPGLRDETTTDAPSRAREEPSIVAALCTCVLGERDGCASAAWPPRSVAELSGRSDDTATGMTQDPGVLEQGLAALDELALRETRWRFAWLDARAQRRLLFQLEAGRGRLSRRHASAFIDAFLTLAAQAYLRDALEPVPQTLPHPLDTP